MKRWLILALFFMLIPNVFALQTNVIDSGISIDKGIKVIYSSFNGSTTDFLRLEDPALETIQGLTLENSQYGKFVFNELINLTKDVVNNTVYLNSNANITFNRVFVDTHALSSFEGSANITLYGLSFLNPRILKNDVICSSCVVNSYSSGRLDFRIDGFSVYSAEETPSAQENESVPAVASAASGGGGSASSNVNFSLSKSILDVKIKQGETKRVTLIVVNTGEKEMLFSIEDDGLSNFSIIDEKLFSLKAGEVKEINIDFFAGEKENADVYAGRINVYAGGIKKVMNIILEIQENAPLFDVSSKLKNNLIEKGDKIIINIDMKNIGDLKKVDVFLEYLIKGFDGREIKLGEESIGVEKELSITREFEIPNDLDYGEYVIFVKLNYNNQTAVSSNYFKLVENVPLLSSFSLAVITSLIIFGLLILIYELKQKKLKDIIRIQQNELNALRVRLSSKTMNVYDALDELKKLKLLRNLLVESYEKGYISKEKYFIEKNKIELAVRLLARVYG